MPGPIEYTVIIKPSVEVLPRSGTVLIGTKDMAAFLGVSPAKVPEVSYSHRVPLPMRLGSGKVVRWNVPELLDWVGAGCPKRSKWVEMNGWSGWIKRRCA